MGNQLQFGALKSKNDIFVFLHADSILPASATTLINNSLSHQNKNWGCFHIAFTNPQLIFNVIAWFMNKRSCLTGIITGDHAIFIKRKTYLNSGGFKDIPIMEDIHLSKQLKKYSRPICIESKVITSSRKWETQGVLKTIIKMWLIRLLYYLGLSPHILIKWY